MTAFPDLPLPSGSTGSSYCPAIFAVLEQKFCFLAQAGCCWASLDCSWGEVPSQSQHCTRSQIRSSMKKSL